MEREARERRRREARGLPLRDQRRRPSLEAFLRRAEREAFLRGAGASPFSISEAISKERGEEEERGSGR
jgi:hypothetical protein